MDRDQAQLQTDNRRHLSVAVDRVLDLAPFLRRITVSGPALEGFRAPLAAQWVKVFVPRTSQSGPPGRAYTIRTIRYEPASIDLDFVLHQDGLCSDWAMRAKSGDAIEIAGPRSGFAPSIAASHLVLGGDETALPAIGAILDAMPEHMEADVFVEIPGRAAPFELTKRSNCRISWLGRGHVAAGEPNSLSRAITGVRIRPGETEAWFAAEAAAAQQVRQHFEHNRTMALKATSVGYWKRGARDHNERIPT